MGISNNKRRTIYKRDGYRCLKCASESRLTIDHIMPLSRGGTDHPRNLQTLCEECNFAKGDSYAAYIPYTEIVVHARNNFHARHLDKRWTNRGYEFVRIEENNDIIYSIGSDSLVLMEYSVQGFDWWARWAELQGLSPDSTQVVAEVASSRPLA